MTNIKKARLEKGLSQKELALTLKVAQPTVSAWESGRKNPTRENIGQLCELLDVTADYLLGLTDNPNPPELVIPDVLKDVKVAFHRGEFEDLTQYEVDRLAEFAEFLKSKRNDDEQNED